MLLSLHLMIDLSEKKKGISINDFFLFWNGEIWKVWVWVPLKIISFLFIY